MYKYLAVVTYLDWRFFKKNGFPRGVAMRKDTEVSQQLSQESGNDLRTLK